MSQKLTWERCDAVSCKNDPIAYVKFPAVSPFTKDKYTIWVRVCEKDFKAELKDPRMEVVKIRKGFTKLVRELTNKDDRVVSDT